MKIHLKISRKNKVRILFKTEPQIHYETSVKKTFRILFKIKPQILKRSQTLKKT